MYIYTTKTTGLFTVYLITHKINNKRYIGIHKEKPNEDLRKYMGSGRALKEAIGKYGVENFTKVILARFDTREEMVAMEKQLVTEDIANSAEYYNRQTGGGHPIMSEASKQKMSESTSGEKHPMYNKNHSEESLQKMREKKQGENHPMFGRTGENNPMYGRTGENHPNAKRANIYCYKTDRLIAEDVVLTVWARENGYNGGTLSATARADRTQPSTTRNPHQHKGIYAIYTA